MRIFRHWLWWNFEVRSSSEKLRCWKSVKATPEFNAIATRRWWVSRVEISSTDDLLQSFGCSYAPTESKLRQLPSFLNDTKRCCIITIENRDRTDLHEFPPKYAGKSGTFFLDPDTGSVRCVLVGNIILYGLE